jgi:hypothetical protein
MKNCSVTIHLLHNPAMMKAAIPSANQAPTQQQSEQLLCNTMQETNQYARH